MSEQFGSAAGAAAGDQRGAAEVVPGQGVVVRRQPLTVAVSAEDRAGAVAPLVTAMVDQLVDDGQLEFGPVAEALQGFVVDHQPTGVAAILDSAPEPIIFLFDQAQARDSSSYQDRDLQRGNSHLDGVESEQTRHFGRGRIGWTTVLATSDRVTLLVGSVDGSAYADPSWSKIREGTVPGSGVLVHLTSRMATQQEPPIDIPPPIQDQPPIDIPPPIDSPPGIESPPPMPAGLVVDSADTPLEDLPPPDVSNRAMAMPPLPDAEPVADTPPMPDGPPISGPPPMPNTSPISGTSPISDTTPISDTPPMPDTSPISGAPPMPGTPPLAGTPPMPDGPPISGPPPMPDTAPILGTPPMPDTPPLPGTPPVPGWLPTSDDADQDEVDGAEPESSLP